jgi:predicted NBD/HSP70 family sugar kinase
VRTDPSPPGAGGRGVDPPPAQASVNLRGGAVASRLAAARLAAQHTGLSLVRVLNEQRVLEVLLREGSSSRARIARLTGLSKPTVSSVMQELVAVGLVREGGRATGNVGRPSNLYEAVEKPGYVFAADVGGSKARAGISDAYGEVVTKINEPTVKASPEAFVAQIAQLFDRLLGEAQLERGLVWAAGVGIPGVYDPSTDRVSSAPNLPLLHELPISAALGDALGVSVVIENDVNLAAVGERWRGLAQDRSHFVAISIGTGIGMGIVLQGELYRGSRGAAGEIDFLPIGAEAFESTDHRGHGPLEWVSTAPSMLERLKVRMWAGEATSVPIDGDIDAIFEAAARGDALAESMIDEEARTVALAIAAVAAVLDPELIVLGGGIGSNSMLVERVRPHVARLFPRSVEIHASALGDEASFYGAVAVALQAAREELLAQVVGAR